MVLVINILGQCMLFFGSYGLVVTIPCALLVMRKWPRSRFPVAIVATLAAFFYGAVVASAVLAIGVGQFDSQHAAFMWTGTIVLGVGSLSYLATGIVGFIWAARTRREVDDGKLTAEGEE